MIVHVARRGHSFKGAGLYYLHDKGASTTERVEWTHTHNLPTDDPDKALKWMAYTTQSSDRLKAEAGVAMTGRKVSAGCVYAFALSWHPEQKPEKEHMLNAAFTTLERLGLKEHEAVMVAHQDTDHPHVHVICNLISPKDGRTAVPSYDRLSLSKWAEEYEKEDGKIYCEERVKNNEQRREKAKEDRQLALVKHREEKLDCAVQVQELYNQSDSGKGFQAALNEAGFTLAQGDRRGFVIVDPYGKIHSLSRQLQGQRAQDIKARLSDIDHALLPQAKTVSEERQYFDRDKYEAEWQMKIEDAAIEQTKREAEAEKEAKAKKQKPSEEKSTQGAISQPERGVPAIEPKTETEPPEKDTIQLAREQSQKWDEIIRNDRETQLQRLALQNKLKGFYNRDEQVKKIEELERQIGANDNIFGRISGKLDKLQEALEAQKLNLASIDQRVNEQLEIFEAKAQKTNPTLQAELKSNVPEPEAKKRQWIEEEKASIHERVKHIRAKDHDLDKGHDLER